jgi:hypothetical protein
MDRLWEKVSGYTKVCEFYLQPVGLHTCGYELFVWQEWHWWWNPSWWWMAFIFWRCCYWEVCHFLWPVLPEHHSSTFMQNGSHISWCGSAKPTFFQDGNRSPLFEVDISTGMLQNTDRGTPVAQVIFLQHMPRWVHCLWPLLHQQSPIMYFCLTDRRNWSQHTHSPSKSSKTGLSSVSGKLYWNLPKFCSWLYGALWSPSYSNYWKWFCKSLLFFPLNCHQWCFYLDFWAGGLIGMTCREGVWLIYTDCCPLPQGHRYWRVCAYTMSYTSIESISIVAHQVPIMTLQLHVGI